MEIKLWAERPRSRDSFIGWGIRFVSTPQRQDRFLGAPSLIFNGAEGFFPPGVKRQEREARLSPSSNTDDMNGANIPSLLYASSWCGDWTVRHRDNFTCTCVLSPHWLLVEYFIAELMTVTS
jgi:hypothetical protein